MAQQITTGRVTPSTRKENNMTKEYRKAALTKALQESLDGNLYYVLLGKNSTFITHYPDVANFYVHSHGYRVYAKCKDGHLFL
jgi:hypothetical protein